MLQSLEDEKLAECTRESKLGQGRDDGWMCLDKFQCAGQFRSPIVRGVDDRNIRQREDRQSSGEKSAKDVDPKHHLLTRNFVSCENLILSRIRRAVQSKIDEEVGDSNKARLR